MKNGEGSGEGQDIQFYKKSFNKTKRKEGCLYEHYEVEVVPHVVLVPDMLLKGHVFVVESLQKKICQKSSNNKDDI